MVGADRGGRGKFHFSHDHNMKNWSTAISSLQEKSPLNLGQLDMGLRKGCSVSKQVAF